MFRDHQLPLVEPRRDVEHAEPGQELAVQLLLARAELASELVRIGVQTPP
ncbi:hypothetical protein [Streptomyces parvus]|nr:hypothetical protein [Streptomyces parvus]MCQ1579950.1 hypothetical protein [Streptomyces parvus]